MSPQQRQTRRRPSQTRRRRWRRGDGRRHAWHRERDAAAAAAAAAAARACHRACRHAGACAHTPGDVGCGCHACTTHTVHAGAAHARCPALGAVPGCVASSIACCWTCGTCVGVCTSDSWYHDSQRCCHRRSHVHPCICWCVSWPWLCDCGCVTVAVCVAVGCGLWLWLFGCGCWVPCAHVPWCVCNSGTHLLARPVRPASQRQARNSDGVFTRAGCTWFSHNACFAAATGVCPIVAPWCF